MKGSVQPFEKLAASLEMLDKLLEAAREEVVFLKKEMAHKDAEKAVSEEVAFEVCQELQHPMISLNITLAGRNQDGKFKRCLTTKSVNEIHEATQQLGFRL